MAKRTSKPNKNQDFMRGKIVYHYDARGVRHTIFVDDNPDAFRRWVEAAKSFTYSRYANPVGDEWLLTLRREKRSKGTYWYAFKSSEGKTHKVYVGSDDNITPDNLKQAVEKMKEKVNT